MFLALIIFVICGKLCHGDKMNNEIIFLKEVDSTNTYAAFLCRDLPAPPTAVVAESQTKGSGRMGRSFFSPENTGIYMTYILNTENVKTLNLITSAAGLAVAKALEETGVCTKIKWPNDIIISSKKVCGILTKLITENGKIKYALIGIGINVLNEKCDFPEELQNVATSLKIETGKAFDKNTLIKKVIKNLDLIFKDKTISEEEIVAEVKQRSEMLGKKVFVKSENREFFAVDISPDGGLVVLEDGAEKVIHSGEVELI